MKYLLIILFSLYVLSSGAENRVVQKEDEKEVSIDEFIHKDAPKMPGSFMFMYRMEDIIWKYRMINLNGIFW